jgi:LysM repeat protein
MKHLPLVNDRTNGRARRAAIVLGAAAAALLSIAPVAHAQRAGRQPSALRGSKASVEKMYSFARQHGYPFYLTPATLDDAIAKGKLVPLPGDENYELARGVGFSYTTAESRDFIMQFAPQYLAVCGTPLTVTSAARPMSRQPRNANPHSVHPTGIAVDIRRPYPGPCLTWVRNTLAELEARGFVEATEEHHPVHIHLAVLKAPGSRFRLPDLTNGVRVARQSPPSVLAASMTPAPAATTVSNVSSGSVSLSPASRADSGPSSRLYQVRQGDTLWDVAQMAGVSVKALAAANNRSTRGVLKPGTVLKLPEPGTR